ncbi:MAG: 50S ribosomal protein L24, partial [Cyclobacteriaceae bacterium]
MERKSNKQQKLHIRKGDTVKVLTGNDRTKTGKVLEIIADKSRAIVEGINIVTKHQKPTAGKPEGGIKKMEGTIHISNLMLVDPGTGKA